VRSSRGEDEDEDEEEEEEKCGMRTLGLVRRVIYSLY